MAITEKDTSLKNLINSANPNALPDQFRVSKLGDILRALPTYLRKKAPAADAGVLATLHAVGLAEDGRAQDVLSAYARAGGVTGPMTIVAPGATPGSGEIAVAPNGDVVTLAADAITDLDVTYRPEKYDTIELTLAVVANVASIPAAYVAQGVVLLLEATADEGTAPGAKIVLAAGGAPAAGQAALDAAKATVAFAGADAVTKATVKLGLASDVDLDALLTAESDIA